jgi:hypothetical protein
MITLTGTLKDIFSNNDQGASVAIQLVGYGSQVPRIAGTAMLAKTAPLQIVVPANGQFSQTIYGNDQITPLVGPYNGFGTYYVVQVLDEFGNVIQANAYSLTGSGSQDISAMTPLALLPPSVMSPAIFGALVAIAYSATPVFPAALGTTFDITLTGNVTSSTMTNVNPGSIYTFIIVQDATGNRTFAWPANVKNAEAIAPAANAISVQSFVARANGNLYPISGMKVN